ncbi:hypothetical protein EYF80_029499 [Liparis tanakae]|uniref:Uncharacterized protein n=1 Tax=Liparis tanakae TaxID=230148 RepID=A0A4Z2H6B9_9TELE|nr:hypothetical protein EYF80_029499 [Liparis tanakae]
MALTYLTVMGLLSVRPTPSTVKLQSFTGSGKGFNMVSSAVTNWFTVASPSSCREPPALAENRKVQIFASRQLLICPDCAKTYSCLFVSLRMLGVRQSGGRSFEFWDTIEEVTSTNSPPMADRQLRYDEDDADEDDDSCLHFQSHPQGRNRQQDWYPPPVTGSRDNQQGAASPAQRRKMIG